MTKMFTTLSLGFILLTSCGKDDVQSPEPTAAFSATYNNQPFTFEGSVFAFSEKNSSDNYELTIIGNKQITSDSSVQIRFVIPDFTVAGSTQQSVSLNPNNARSGFIEYKTSVSGFHGRYNFMQSGQLNVSVHDSNYLDGTFSFTYFTFDKYGAKTGEVNITNGTFTNVKLKRQ